MHPKVLIVDDEVEVLEGIRRALWKTPYDVHVARGADEALAMLRDRRFDIVVADHLMPGMTGLAFLGLVHDRQPDAVRIMLSGHADLDTVIRTINEGEVHRFLKKPCERTELLVALHSAWERVELQRENRLLLALIQTQPQLLARLEEERARVRRGEVPPSGGDAPPRPRPA